MGPRSNKAPLALVPPVASQGHVGPGSGSWLYPHLLSLLDHTWPAGTLALDELTGPIESALDPWQSMLIVRGKTSYNI